MTGTIGCDVSGFQTPRVLASGDWLFAFVKLSEGTGASNRNFTQQWSDALRFFKRGVYHYARPHSSDGVHQANTFCDLALGAGFKPGVDMWMLDAEGLGNDVRALGNEAVTGAEWSAFTRAFMGTCQLRLGALGFLYVGQYFFPYDFGPLTQQYPWVLPNYGRNDGLVHALPNGVNPIIHQFTSAGGLDKDIVHDFAGWLVLTGAHAIQGPKPTKRKANRVLSVQGVPVLDDRHLPYIDIADGGKSIVAFFCEPFNPEPRVKTAFGLSAFALAPGEVAIDIAPGDDGKSVVVRLANNEAHEAILKAGVIVR